MNTTDTPTAYFVTYLNTETGEETTKTFACERDAVRVLGNLDIMEEMTLVSTNVVRTEASISDASTPFVTYFVTYRNTDTGREVTETFDRPGYHNELDAVHLVSDVGVMMNLELVATNVDRSKFRC